MQAGTVESLVALNVAGVGTIKRQWSRKPANERDHEHEARGAPSVAGCPLRCPPRKLRRSRRLKL
ncbi:hypothetical protein PC116_g2340 [Phytophthora cactorum]|uniref:Uncharacterized protein n=1 Tax=Phytophthora cactorum TaxID=29920 RepID=A0A8T1LPZ8_9STRA|nr:hypothetical protein PC114_g6888 [Phytophthora cactorum]KAG2947374.1 hypothetical protein PC117_g6854 [Phytophthora cactorum]KAG3193354.1 hypothetical protein C6341_g144 [Phytophthora cactorum]KAG4249919.1 hypothetical protein PC116_g2340 [Phytophthora cactorum]